MTRQSVPDMDDLVPHTHPSAAWSDRYSNVVLTWERPREFGLQRFQVLGSWMGTKITDRLLSWTIHEGGAPLSLVLDRRVYRPDVVREHLRGEDLDMIVRYAFPARDALGVEMTFENRREQPRELDLRFLYPGRGIRPAWTGPCPPGRFFSLEGEPEGSWSTLFVNQEHGRNVPWVSGFVAGMTEITTTECICLADLTDRRVVVSPSGASVLPRPLPRTMVV